MNTLSETEKLPTGFTLDPTLTKRPDSPKSPLVVRDLKHLKELIYQGYRVEDLDVRGDTRVENTTTIHPVVEALYRRAEAKKRLAAGGDTSKIASYNDGMKIAVAIEGGGMRGCVAAGMITSLWYLGLEDAVDVVYGSSAGSLVGAYFISKQLPYFGPEVYYDVLTSAGKEFIDAQAILRSIGLGVFDLRVESLMSLYRDRMGKPGRFRRRCYPSAHWLLRLLYMSLLFTLLPPSLPPSLTLLPPSLPHPLKTLHTISF